MQVLPGRAFPLGATPGRDGTNVAVVSATAESMTLCLLDERGRETRLPLTERDADVWHGFVPGMGVGQRYGFRASGPYDPSRGLRFDPSKLLLDPYAKAVHGELRHGPAIYGYDIVDHNRPSGIDSAGSVPVSVVADPEFDWSGDVRPDVSYARTIVYELHAKGFTAAHPRVPAELRGTYAGLVHPAALEHLVDLGITAVELLPVHQSVTEPTVAARGLVNYWGYNTLGFFAPHAGYSAAVRRGEVGGQVAEFKTMVKALHRAGLEVILDVVFNHTAEGSERGPTLSFRGLDNGAYYRLDPGNPAVYVDTTGCGNAMDMSQATALRLVMDSLRYWVQDMHVDGFRFDLAATLGRDGEGSFDRTAAFFDMVTQDPVVSRVKLIAEPWDVGRMDSYGVGRFPPLWSEWNGKYRDTVREFWRSTPGELAAYATRITGSSDLYGGSLRRPTASVNFVTAHDGFTLRDLVTYDHKHNEANREDNHDGTDDNRSWNCGVEGPTTDRAVLSIRSRQQRAFLTALLTSFGIPMLLGGDELGRTQQGNNNAYCQDSPLTWFDWSDVDEELLAYTKRLIRLRREHPVFRRRRFLSGAAAEQIQWFTPTGTAMTPDQWQDPNARAVTLYLDGQDHPDVGTDGTVLLDDDMLLMVNAWWEPLVMVLPPVDGATTWLREVDSFDITVGASADPPAPGDPLKLGDSVTVGPRSILLLRGRR